MIYLLFAKIEDELLHDKECRFVIFDSEYDDIHKGLNSTSFHERIIAGSKDGGLFEKVKKRQQFKDIFDANDRVEIPPMQIAKVVSELEHVSLLASDAKGDAFQAFLSSNFRGDAGQFFTPDPIKQMVVDMVEPRPEQVVLDPACGSSGFLIFTLNRWRNSVKERAGYLDANGQPKHDSELAKPEREHVKSELKLLAKDYIRGMDFDNDLTKVAKMYMVMVDDGHTGIFTVNSLLPLKEISRVTSTQIHSGCAQVILTNPPFGTRGRVKQSSMLQEYDFGYRWRPVKHGSGFAKGKFLGDRKQNGQVPDILFVERCVQLLDDGGVMAIVLPDGDLTNQNTAFVRDWLLRRLRVQAVVSLPGHTFDPYGTGVKSCVLFAEKPRRGEPLPQDYPVFLASLENIGYDIRGRTTYRRINGNVIDDDGTELGFRIVRDGLRPVRRDRRNLPLDKDGAHLETYYDEAYRRLYRAEGGVPLDDQGKPVPTKRLPDGSWKFERDKQGYILASKTKGKPKRLPCDQFSREQDPKLIEKHGAVANDIPAVIAAWRGFKGSAHRDDAVQLAVEMEKLQGPVTTDHGGLPKKKTFYVKALSEIDAVGRLHPDYWQPRFDVLLRRLQTGTERLGTIATLKGGATPKGSSYLLATDADAVPFLRIQNVGDFGLSLDDLVYIPKEVHTGQLKRSQVNPNDVLFTITGRLGSVAVVPATLTRANINQHIVRIRLKEEYMDRFTPAFVAAHLRSSVMRELIEREQYGTTRVALDYKTINEFRIPFVPLDAQREISDKLNHAADLIVGAHKASAEAYESAEQLGISFLAEAGKTEG